MIYRIPILMVAAWVSDTIGSWAVDRDPPTTVVNREVVTPILRPGEDLQIKFTMLRHRRCEIRSDRQIIDSKGVQFLLDPIIVINPPVDLGMTTPFTLAVPTPSNMAAGRAQFQYAATWVCNPIHRVFPIRGEPVEINFDVWGN
jgi:hypothetical protein